MPNGMYCRWERIRTGMVPAAGREIAQGEDRSRDGLYPIKRTTVHFSATIRLGCRVVKNDHSFYYRTMPRVSPEHSEARRSQIIAAARACFLREGFHQTSMQDIQREAGLSAGAIYLYFKSKRELILAIAQSILGTVSTVFPDEPVVEGESVDIPTLIRLFLKRAEDLDRQQAIFPIALMVWSEATRDPTILAEIRTSLQPVINQVQGLVKQCQHRGLLDPDADPLSLTMALIGWAQGFIIQRTLLDPGIRERYSDGMESLLRYRPALEPRQPAPKPA
jgi:AcrR family transcriptional regulator